MNVEEMTAEQLMEAAQAKAGEQSPAASTRTVEVDGTQVTIDVAKLQTWKAFKLIRKIDAGGPVEKVDAAMQFAGLVSDFSEEQIVEHMGGDDASMQGVVAFAMKILEAAYPKN